MTENHTVEKIEYRKCAIVMPLDGSPAHIRMTIDASERRSETPCAAAASRKVAALSEEASADHGM
jgi:hypothetical protein